MMFGSDILEVAIGMVFLYLFMSMIASALREAIEALLQERAVYLERGLKEMLRTGAARPGDAAGQGDGESEAESFVATFYNHPIISSLYKGDYVADAGPKAEPGSFIGKLLARLPQRSKLPAYIPSESFALAVLDLAAKASADGKKLSIARLESTLGTTPNNVQRVVLLALSTAGDDLSAVRKHLEDWYDATMQRVTGWYARRSAAFLFLIGLGAAVTLNVDSITIAKSLIVDRPLRQAIVAQAETYAKTNPEKPAAGQDAASKGSAGTDGQTQSFDVLRAEFTEIGYPIGWTSVSGSWLPYPTPQACVGKPGPGSGATLDCSKGAGGGYWGILLLALMGWLITAIAIMLGAPFWFDLLNKLISLRSAVKPAQDKPKSASAKKPAAGPPAADDTDAAPQGQGGPG